MTLLKSGPWLNASGEYNFATDPSLGAIGTVSLGVFIPQLALIKHFSVNTLTAFVGGASNIAFTGTSLGTGGAITLLAATAIAGFVVGPVGLRGTDLDATPFKCIGGSYQINMTIAGAPITAGRVQFFIEYVNNAL